MSNLKCGQADLLVKLKEYKKNILVKEDGMKKGHYWQVVRVLTLHGWSPVRTDARSFVTREEAQKFIDNDAVVGFGYEIVEVNKPLEPESK